MTDRADHLLAAGAIPRYWAKAPEAKGSFQTGAVGGV